MTSSLKKVYNNLLKLAILCLAAVFIYNKLSDNTNLRNFKGLISELSPTVISLTLLFVFFLMLVNWLLEALKWQYLVRRIERIGLWRAIESVFCGLTIAVFTPNRIGEYGGRVFFLSPRKRLHGVVAMGIGSLGQMVLTNVIGAVAIGWFLFSFIPGNTLFFGFITLAILLFSAFFLIFYFNINWLIDYLLRLKFLQRFSKFFRVFSRYEKVELMKVFGYCLLRFGVFTSQYCLVIKMLIPSLPILSVAMMVFILFFIQSALPSLDLLDVGVRTFTASYFFSYITHQDVAIIATTAFIWLVNLIIPAILGAPFVFKLNFFGTNRN
ncbi:lysylphosphatidylglycerol synthase domain-containing protein [Desertivirga brevis]|uniref:lysylphosphatidylglycerol synthase domain-containing protein n=1 Tax=Desertivirga brevis TaxID=2810310 RepID=UPI001A964C87|nr:lysylphosphatidylglycerol synthase domain-containing protein [Pedobacter sp. SYSU D00873]